MKGKRAGTVLLVAVAILGGSRDLALAQGEDGAPGEPGRVGSSDAGEPGPDGPSGQAGRSYTDRIAEREAEAARRIAERTGRVSSGGPAETETPTSSPEPRERASDQVQPSNERSAKRDPALPAILVTLLVFGVAALVLWLRRRRAA